MNIFKPFKAFLLVACLALPGMTSTHAQAGQNEIDLLAFYIGDWKGAGDLKGADEPETFRCRLNVTNSKLAKINYAGRCTLVGLNLSVAGTIAYNDATNRYEAVMSSNTAFSGQAFGKISGPSITFDLKERDTDEKGRDMTIGAKIFLHEDTITVDFDVMFNDSGKVMTASVPFARL